MSDVKYKEERLSFITETTSILLTGIVVKSFKWIQEIKMEIVLYFQDKFYVEPLNDC